MPELLARVVECTSRYNMFGRGDRIGVAVSGGADSLCLLYLLAGLSEAWNLKLFVLHVDHQLRGSQSEADAEFVREHAVLLGLPFHLARVNVAEIDDNLEQAARNARRSFFHEMKGREALRCIATGHTQSDQAETVLFRMLRGAGNTGLCGIRPVTRDGIVRPLIEIARADVEAYLQGRNIAWREDASNLSPEFARNRIRHQLLPYLSREWNPALPAALARTAALALEDEEYWGNQVEAVSNVCIHRRGEAAVVEISRLLSHPPALVRRVLRRLVELVRGDLRHVDFAHIQRLFDLIRQLEGRGRVQFAGIEAVRSFDWLRLAPLQHPPEFDYEVELSVPSSVTAGGVTLKMDREANLQENCDYNEKENCLDWDRLAGTLVLRNWRSGDCYRPAGRAAGHKVKKLFQETRIPLWERRHWPVIAAGGRIVWVREFGPAHECAPTRSTRNVLRVRIFPNVS